MCSRPEQRSEGSHCCTVKRSYIRMGGRDVTPCSGNQAAIGFGKKFQGWTLGKKKEKRNGRFMRTLPQHHRLSPWPSKWRWLQSRWRCADWRNNISTWLPTADLAVGVLLSWRKYNCQNSCQDIQNFPVLLAANDAACLTKNKRWTMFLFCFLQFLC